MTDKIRAMAVADRILAGFNKGDIASFADCFHPDLVAEFPFPIPGLPPVLKGKAAVLELMTVSRAGMESMKMTASKRYWVPDEMALIIEASGEAHLAGNVPYNNRYVFVLGFRDGLVVLWREYLDNLIVQTALSQQPG